MLILTRRIGETIKIGEAIEVTVLGVKGQQVRIGVNAPRSVAIHREEIAEKIAEGGAPHSYDECCTVCHVAWVDTANGFDTCAGCLNAA